VDSDSAVVIKRRCSKCRKRKEPGAFYQHPETMVYDAWCRLCKNNESAIRRALAQGKEVDWSRLERIRSGQPDWKNPVRRAAENRIRHLAKHGLTPESYQDLLASQGGVCASCARETPDSSGRIKMFPVDHDHSCCPGEYSCGKCIRGLICVACNTTAGVLESVRAVQVMAYLERVNSGISRIAV
jgi:hypothetical protein